MTSEIKQLIAVTLFVVGIFQGTNVMVNDGADTAGFIRVVVLLGGALLFWFWTMREKSVSSEDPQETMDSAEESLTKLDETFKTIEDKIEQQISPKKPEAPTPPAPKPKTDPPKTAKTEPKPASTTEADDLTRIEGIGPSYCDILVQAGINTFAKLAAMNTDEIISIVRENGGRKHRSMDTWSEQAKLAAAGDWDGLTKLQDSLSGGARK